MVLPIDPILALNPVITREQNEEILRYELQLMSSELPELEKFRDYYDGDQGMVFGTEKFKEEFGDAFEGFRDNWCLPPDAPVVTSKGVIPVGSIKPGDSVLTHDGKHRPVQQVFVRQVDEEIVRLRTYGSAWVRITGNHPVLASRVADLDTRTPGYGDDRHFQVYGSKPNTAFWKSSICREWIRADDLKKGDIVWARAPQEPTSGAYSDDMLKLLGWYVAEGSVSDNGRIAFSLHAEEHEYAEEIEGLIKSVCGLKTARVIGVSNDMQVVAYSHEWVERLAELGGRKAAGKKLAPDVMTGPTTDLLVRAWRGDGSTPTLKSPSLAYGTVSLDLAVQIQQMLLREGIVPAWQTKKPREGRQQAYILKVSGESARKLAHLLEAPIAESAWTKAPSGTIVDGWIGYAVAEIGSESHKGDVYDLQVEDSHSFVLPGCFAVHNCAPVIEAPADKLFAEGIRLGTTEEEIKANEALSRDIWNIFRANDIDEQQADVHEGAFVEGRSYMIVWPDNTGDRGIRLDWNPADLIRVRYADDDPRKIVWAMKRWLTPSGQVFITTYTANAIYKYTEPAKAVNYDTRTGIEAQRPQTAPSQSFDVRETMGESWPLRNPYNIVPVVEFMNKRESELHDVIPLQDGVNYLMLQGLTMAGFQGFPQRGFFSGVREPTGGWSNEPGQVWQLPPDIDADGNHHQGRAFEFRPSDPTGVRGFVEMTLQHIALQTKTPVRMFFQSDRGGRGDAPSGESLLVEDQPLLDKVEDRQNRFGNSWYRVARMVARMSEDLSDDLPLGEIRWKDPRAKYRSALIEEGAKMVDKMGMPIKFVATQLGFSEDEKELLYAHLDEMKKEQEEAADKEAERQAQAQPAPGDGPPSNESRDS